ncbi:MAG: transglycosylase SLT domain-containing protein [Gammaproteobacteria bacterium]
MRACWRGMGFGLVVLQWLAIAASAGAVPADDYARQLARASEPWTGDFDAMLDRRLIRVLVPHSRTLFFNDQGEERGLTAELAREFERRLNRNYARQLGRRPLTVFLIPTTRDRLLPGLRAGLGDIAAGNLTVTPSRRVLADFVLPDADAEVREIVVTGPDAPPLRTLDDLAGQTVHVRMSTSYAESLAALNVRFVAAGKAPIDVVPLPEPVEDEDKLEMVNVGILDIVVVDDWVARLWKSLLPGITVREDLVVRDGDRTGWAIRPGSPLLAAEIQGFFADLPRGLGTVRQRVAMLNRHLHHLHDNTHTRALDRFARTIGLFEKYGNRYGFDPLILAAQGFQESRLRQEARSKRGAIGVMQVMPATARELDVGDITQLEPNIHAGAKYMSTLVQRHFAEADFGDFDRPLFAFASYNAGPGAIARIRREAARRGFDPNRWFNHVEVVVAEKIGMQTTSYVRNISKYYVAYRLLNEAKAARDAIHLSRR